MFAKRPVANTVISSATNAFIFHLMIATKRIIIAKPNRTNNIDSETKRREGNKNLLSTKILVKQFLKCKEIVP